MARGRNMDVRGRQLTFLPSAEAGLCTKVRYVAESAHFVLWLAY